MHTTYSKTSKAKRFASVCLAALMCIGGMNLGALSANNDSLNFSAYAANIEEKEGSAVYQVSDTPYYDSGTMWLQGYYSATVAADATNPAVTSDPTYINTDGKYKYDASHYHDTDGWLTLKVTSNLPAGSVTLPSTTNINEIDTNNIMSCWREYLGKMGDNTPGSAEAEYGINTVDFGTPAAKGEVFSYIAQATTEAVDIDNDDVDEIQINWQIRAWPQSLGDAPSDEDAIILEWNNIKEDIEVTQTVHGVPAESYKSNFYKTCAPEWQSGNNWYDKWIGAPATITDTNWGKSNSDINYYNTATRKITGLTMDNIDDVLVKGTSLIYPFTQNYNGLGSGGIPTTFKVKIDNTLAVANQGAGAWVNIDPTTDLGASEVRIGLAGYPQANYVAVGNASNDMANAIHTWTWSSKTDTTHKSYYPDLGGMMVTAANYTVEDVIKPIRKTADNKTEAPTVRVYGYYLSGFGLDGTQYKIIMDADSMKNNTNYLLYGGYKKNNAVVDVNALDLSTAADQTTFKELAGKSVNQWNVALVYDYTYGQQRAGGDISAYREIDLDASISTDLTINVNGTDKKYADTSTNSVLTETVHYTLADEALNKTYRIIADLYEVSYDANDGHAILGNKLTTKTTDDLVITNNNGDVPVVFDAIDTTALSRKSVVACATLERKDGNNYAVAATHADENDVREQVLFTNVFVETTLTSTANGTHMIPAKAGVALVDEVKASGLASGKQYYVVGELNTIEVEDSENGPVENVVVVKESPATEVKTAGATGELTFNVPYTIDLTDADVDKYYVATVKLYEKIDEDTTNLVFVHNDLKNENQTVYVPSIETDAVDGTTNTQQGVISNTATIKDAVHVNNIVAGTYTISGKVMQGTNTLATKTETVNISEGDIINGRLKNPIEMTFTLNSSALAGKNIVVCETLYAGSTANVDAIIATHENLNDSRQTVYEPFIDTVATAANGTHNDVITTTATINDVVSYENLIVGETYTLTGSLVDKNGNPVKINGNAISATKSFKPIEANGTETVQFIYDATVNNLDKVICYEVLSLGTNEIVSHKDVNDADQTVSYIESSFYTTAYTTSESIKDLEPIEKATINDKVVYSQLAPNTSYKLVAELFDKTANDYVKKNGTKVTVTPTFVSSGTGNGDVVVTFNDVDVSALAGHDIVVYQHLYLGDILVKELIDVNDVNETVHVINPTVATVLAETSTGNKVIPCSETAKVTDTITYTGLIKDNTYRFESRLVLSDGTYLKDKSGNDVIVTKEFVGTVNNTIVQTADFTIDTRTIAGKSVIAYNSLYRVIGNNSYLLLTENSLTNAAQTVTVPSISTKATDASTGIKTLCSSATNQVKDTVTYSGLIPNKQYTLTLTVYNKTDGKLLMDATNTNPITGTQQFTPKSASGSVDVTVTFDTTNLAGKALVCYEKLVADGKEYAIHADPNDKDQTVYVASIDTLLTGKDGTAKVVNVSENTQLVDKITYTGLDTTATYTVTGTLIDINNENKVVATKTQTYKPGETAVDGSFEVEFVVDTSNMNEHKLVAFETVTYTKGDKTALIMEHKDASDADQTISVVTTTVVNTGVEYFANTFAIISVLMLIGCIAITTVIMVRRKKSLN